MKRLLLLLCVMLPCVSLAQVRIVKGIVFGPNDTPIEGVDVCAVGSSESTTTDKGGNFELSVSPYATFVEAKMEGYFIARAEIDGSFLMLRLKQNKKYWVEKAKAEEAERLAAERAEAARLKAEEEARIAEQKRIEAERLAAEKAEEEARIAEQKRIEAERLAVERAEAARLKAEEEARIAEQERIEAERLAAEKAEEEARIAEQKRIEAERLAAEMAEAARLKAEEEARIAEQERIEAERLAAERAEATRLKAEEEVRLAEQKRIEAERLAAEMAEAARLKAEEEARIAEQKRVEAEKKLAEKKERRELWSEKQKGYASIVEYESFTGFGEKSNFSNSGVKYIAGYKLNNQLFLGAGLGVNLNYHSGMVDYLQLSDGCYLNPSLISLPIFAYFKVNILNRRCSPFIAVASGVSFSPKQTIHFIVGDAKYSNLSPFINPQLGVNFRISTYRSIYLATGLQFRSVPCCIDYSVHYATIKPVSGCGLTLQLGFMF